MRTQFLFNLFWGVLKFFFWLTVVSIIICWILDRFGPQSKYRIVNKFIKQKVAIHCQTEQEAEQFIYFCMKIENMKWINPKNSILPSLTTYFYDRYGKETCYSYGKKGKKLWRLYNMGVTYSNYHSYVDNGFEILSFQEFQNKIDEEKNKEKERYYSQVEDQSLKDIYK